MEISQRVYMIREELNDFIQTKQSIASSNQSLLVAGPTSALEQKHPKDLCNQSQYTCVDLSAAIPADLSNVYFWSDQVCITFYIKFYYFIAGYLFVFYFINRFIFLQPVTIKWLGLYLPQ